MPLTWAFFMERMTGIEPACSAWETDPVGVVEAVTCGSPVARVTVADRLVHARIARSSHGGRPYDIRLVNAKVLAQEPCAPGRTPFYLRKYVAASPDKSAGVPYRSRTDEILREAVAGVIPVR